MNKRRVIAEFEPTQAIMLTWPHDATQWGEQLEAAQRCIATIGAWCSSQCDVIVCAHDLATEALATSQLDHACQTNTQAQRQRITVYRVPSNNIWVRDHGPIAVRDNNGRVRLLNFDFNGWGGKYPHAWDNAITDTLDVLGAFGVNVPHNIPFVLEGGAIDSDGCGNIITTSSCLLNGNRNRYQHKEDVETALNQWLGPHQYIWIDQGAILGDDTDGHIDTLVRFLRASVVAYQQCEDPKNPNYAALQALEEELWKKMWFGRRIPLPMPQPIFNEAGEQLPATYVNYLICNDLVLVPTYNDPADEIAIQRMQDELADHHVIGVDCRAIIHEFGSLHCATMQLPVGAIFSEETQA